MDTLFLEPLGLHFGSQAVIHQRQLCVPLSFVTVHMVSASVMRVLDGGSPLLTRQTRTLSFEMLQGT